MGYRRAFTLFEVMLSMLLMAITILSIAALLPSGLKAQEAARYQALAAVTSLNLMARFENLGSEFNQVSAEGLNMWRTAITTHEPGMYDVERVLSSPLHAQNSLVPLPLEIAYRLDSENDEMRSILDAGGYLYFPSPIPVQLAAFEGNARNTEYSYNVVEETVPYAYEGFDEAQRLVVGFVGEAQHNALPWHPMTTWPGREYYPMAPLNSVRSLPVVPRDVGLIDGDEDRGGLQHDPDWDASIASDFTSFYETSSEKSYNGRGNPDHAAWAYWRANGQIDAAVYARYARLFHAYAGFDQDRFVALTGAGRSKAAARVEANHGAIWWQHYLPDQEGLTDSGAGDGTMILHHLALRAANYLIACRELVDACSPHYAGIGTAPPDRPRPWEIRALRYYAHAAMWTTRFHDGRDLDEADFDHDPLFEQTYDDHLATLYDGSYAAAYADYDAFRDAFYAALELARGARGEVCGQAVRIHEDCLRWTMAYQTNCPWDWGAPRPFNRALMVDHPLIQQDLFNAAGAWVQPGSGGDLSNLLIPDVPHASDPPAYRVIAPRGCSLDAVGDPRMANTFAAGYPSTARALGFPDAVVAPMDPVADVADIPTNVTGNWRGNDKTWHYQAGRIAEGWGRSDHYTLMDAFQPSHRCRQMVIWAVDWQRYQDAESAAAAPTDASWFPHDSALSRSTLPVAGSYRPYYNHYVNIRGPTGLGRMGALSQMLNWKQDPDADPLAPLYQTSATATVGSYTLQQLNRGTSSAFGGSSGPRTTYAAWYGRYGIDANGNNRFDRGSLPPSVRLRATTIARFNLYDPRVWHGLRN